MTSPIRKQIKAACDAFQHEDSWTPEQRNSAIIAYSFAASRSNIRKLLDECDARDAELADEKERVRVLREAVSSLLPYDAYQTEYDGQILIVCPACGEQDGAHTPSCSFVEARAVLTQTQPKEQSK